jgi:isoquinoline 1-oxidoreductase subunit alpha
LSSAYVNGNPVQLDAPADMPLLWALRDLLGLTGTKFGCGIGECGACTVHVNGKATRSCMVRIGELAGEVTTIEAVGNTPEGKRAQDAWLSLEVIQCGYCQCGQIMAASALLASNPHPDDAAIDSAMSGNICRCCTYPRIREAIKRA